MTHASSRRRFLIQAGALTAATATGRTAVSANDTLEAAVLGCGLNGSHFSSYGSEKKGSPVRSFVRLCPAGRAIRRSDPIASSMNNTIATPSLP